MTESKFHGVIPPVVIPLTAERTLDLEALELDQSYDRRRC